MTLRLAGLTLGLITLLATPLTHAGYTLDGQLLACGNDAPPTITGRYSKGANGDTPPAEKLVEMGRKIFLIRACPHRASSPARAATTRPTPMGRPMLCQCSPAAPV